MRVHVVAERLNADRILPRLARYLAQGNGWTLSDSPDPQADANYFCNYITWRQHFNGWHKTWTSAFFTHKDQNVALKAKYWDDAAQGIDQAVICARMWAKDLPAGKVIYARPPVEVDRFTIMAEPRGRKPIVGFSGFTYADGRKNEGLAAQLVRSKPGQQCEWKASGRGWPVPTRAYSWKNMPAFFQSLNVLVTTADTEGIPMPPLEALACGVRIVVPEHCGVLEELPDIAGIYRYRNNDIESLTTALEKAALEDSGVDREALRHIITSNYTVSNWCADHREAIERGLELHRGITRPARQRELDMGPFPDWHGRAGIYCVAFGEPSRKCARRLIASVKKQMPGLPIAVVAASPLGGENFAIQHPDSDIGGRIAKLKADQLAPGNWQYVLYLDADTELVQDISFLFQLLQDGWEAVICKDMKRYSTADQMLRPDNRDEANYTWEAVVSKTGTFQYNGGMMAFRRCTATQEFFKIWREEWQRFGKRDQGALLRALYKNPLKLYLLTNQWNASDRYPMPPGQIAIVHHNTQARRWGGLVKGRIDSPEAWAAVQQWRRGVR